MQNQSFRKLKEVAAELNKSLYLNPPIDYIRTTKDRLLQEVKKTAEIIKPGDKVKQDVLDFLIEIGAKLGIAGDEYVIFKTKEVVKKDKFSVYDCYTKDYDRASPICSECLRKENCRRLFRQSIALLKKMKGIVAIKGQSGLEIYKYTRHHALIDALKIGGSKDEVIQMSNELFIQKGGEDNERKAKSLFNYVIPALLIVKSLRKHEDFYLLKKI